MMPRSRSSLRHPGCAPAACLLAPPSGLRSSCRASCASRTAHAVTRQAPSNGVVAKDVFDGLAARQQPVGAVCDTHDGWFGEAVVVSGHAVGVRAGRVHREEIALADFTRKSHRSEFVVFTRAAAERDLLILFVPRGDGGNVVARAVERRSWVFRDAAVDDYEGAMRLALHG